MSGTEARAGPRGGTVGKRPANAGAVRTVLPRAELSDAELSDAELSDAVRPVTRPNSGEGASSEAAGVVPVGKALTRRLGPA